MYNLLDSKSVAQAISDGVPCMRAHTVDSVRKAMRQFDELQINPQFFNFDAEGVCTVSGDAWDDVTPVGSILNIGKKLNELSSFKNFKSFGASFDNPGQFSSTIFEVDCSHYFSQAYQVQDFEFDAEHMVNGIIKRPDFKASFEGNSEVFGECKSLVSINRIKSSRIIKLKESLFEKIRPLVPDGRRIEISLKALPPNWNSSYSDQIFGAVGEVVRRDFIDKHIEITIDEKHTTWIKLCGSAEKPFFTNIYNVGDVPHNQSPKIILGELANIKRDIKNLIKDARTQISSDSFAVIFLFSLHKTYASQAISEYFKDNDAKKLIGVFSWTDVLEFYQNPFSELMLANIPRA